MDVGEKIGIAITASGVFIDAVELFFPGKIAGMSKGGRVTVFSVGTLLFLAGLCIVFLEPSKSPAAAATPPAVSVQRNNGCTVTGNGNRVNCAPTKPPPPKLAPAKTAPPAQGGNINIQGNNSGNACTNGAKCEVTNPVSKVPLNNPNTLYQLDAAIGTTTQEPVITQSQVQFGELRMTGYLDPTIPVLFRGLQLLCPELDKKETVQNAAMFMDVWTKGATCGVKSK